MKDFVGRGNRGGIAGSSGRCWRSAWRRSATQTAARVGQGVAVLLGLVGLFVSPLLIVIAVFVWLGAKAEHSVSTVKVALAGLSVRHGMIADFKTLSPTDPLSAAVQLTLAGFQQDSPVMDGPRVVGVLTHGDALRGHAERGANVSVEQAKRGAIETVPETAGRLTRSLTVDAAAGGETDR